MRGHAVQRIKEVKGLRARQFAEDAGPLAHPVRPSSYQKIDNFYTATVYDKGAEVIRMLKMYIGDADFRRGMDLYFERWDGHATTVEAFIQCFAEASGRDLTNFFHWYEQAGTPSVAIEALYDPAAKALDLTFTQSTAPTPGQPQKRALPIPIALGLLDQDGGAMRDTEVVILDKPVQRLRLEGVPDTPILSALRGFSAPVNLTTDAPARDAYGLLAADPDLFNRWEAGQSLARDLILARAAGRPDEVAEERYAEAMRRALDDQSAEPALKALLLGLPGEGDLAVVAPPADPAAIHASREALRTRMALHLGTLLRHAARRHAGRTRVVLAGGRVGGTPSAAQRGAGAAGGRSASDEPGAGAWPLRRRRQHDGPDRRAECADADGRRGRRSGVRDVL